MKPQPSAPSGRFFSLVFVFVFLLSGCTPQAGGPKGESLYDRVINAGKIRVGYVVYPPGLIKDPNTGELSGIFYETLEAAGENLGIEIDWTEEVGWGSMIEGLQANRYDIIGSPVWANTSRAKIADFSTPLFYSGIGIYVRSDENRFGDNLAEGAGLAALNNPDIKISTIDGEMSSIIASSQFPEAETVSLTQLSDVSQLFLEVTQRKADVTFAEPFFAHEFLQNNPGTIKNIAQARPIRVFPNTMMFKRGEMEFKSMLNRALEEVINSGLVDEQLDKYEPFPGAFYRVAYPYRTPGS